MRDHGVHEDWWAGCTSFIDELTLRDSVDTMFILGSEAEFEGMDYRFMMPVCPVLALVLSCFFLGGVGMGVGPDMTS